MKKHLLFITMVLFLSAAASSVWGESGKTAIIEDLTASEFTEKIRSLENPESFMIIDVRTPGEFAMERIKGAVNINFYDKNFETDISKLDREKKYFIYCRSGNRSGKALNRMSRLGFIEVYNLRGGIGSDKKNLDIEK